MVMVVMVVVSLVLDDLHNDHNNHNYDNNDNTFCYIILIQLMRLATLRTKRPCTKPCLMCHAAIKKYSPNAIRTNANADHSNGQPVIKKVNSTNIPVSTDIKPVIIATGKRLCGELTVILLSFCLFCFNQ